MELEITTKMSMLVGFAGFLAEIIFRETLTGSVLGVVLSVVLAAIILCCTYFAVDGFQRSFSAVHKREENRRREYDEKLFRLLNKKLSDQVKLEKGIYSLLAKGAKKDFSAADTGTPEDYWKELAESIDNSSLKAAKLVVKYNQKNQEESGRIMGQNSEEMLQAIRSMSNQLQVLNGEIQEMAARAAAMAEENRTSAAPPLQTSEEESFQPIGDGETEEVTSGPEEGITEIEEEFPVEEEVEAASTPEEEIKENEEEFLPEEEALEAASTPEEEIKETGEEFLPEEETVETASAPEEEMKETAEEFLIKEGLPETVSDPGDDMREAEEEAVPPSTAQSAVLQGMEDADVNRMMEELFNESLAVEPEAETEVETEVETTALETVADRGEMEMPDGTAALDDADDMSEEDLDSLLSGLLPEPAPLMEETIEESKESAGGGMTALDMLLSQHRAEPKPSEDVSDTDMAAEPALDSVAEADDTDEGNNTTDEGNDIGGENDAGSGTAEPDAVLEQADVPKEGKQSEPESGTNADDSDGKMSPDDIAALLASLDS